MVLRSEPEFANRAFVSRAIVATLGASKNNKLVTAYFRSNISYHRAVSVTSRLARFVWAYLPARRVQEFPCSEYGDSFTVQFSVSFVISVYVGLSRRLVASDVG